MEDLLDLEWSSSKGGSSANKPVTRPAPGFARQNSSSYTFDALTRSTATPPLRPSPSPRPTQISNSSAGRDAFSSLLDLGSGAGTGSNIMTLAERQRLAAAASGLASKPAATTTTDAAWGAVDDWDAMLLSSNKKPTEDNVVNSNSSDAFHLSAFSVKPSAVATSSGRSASRTPAAPPQAKPGSMDLFDFSEFEDPGASQSSALGSDGEDEAVNAPLAKASWSTSDEPDELADFLSGKPTPSARRSPAPSARAAPRQQQQQSSDSATRSVSPPPHILGQIVEMGFSPAQARAALAATPSGLDVNAALEALLGDGTGGAGAAQSGREGQDADRRLAERLQRQERQGTADDGEWDGEARRSAAQRARWGASVAAGGGASPVPSARRREDSRRATTGDEAADGEWTKQADMLYAQASEIGAGLFKSANAFWTTAKTTAQKAIEERTASNAASAEGSRSASPAAAAAERHRNRRWGVGGAGKKDPPNFEGKPRWMVEAEAAENQATAQAGPPTPKPTSGFKDSDDEGESPAAAPIRARPTLPSRAPSSARVPTQTAEASVALWDLPAEQAPPAPPRRVVETSNASRAPYVSPARRGGASRPSASAPAPVHCKRAPRSLPVDAPSVVALAARHKLAGNEAFKKGAYGDAEIAYGNALSALNEASLRRVPLLNNRASARLKNGDAAGAVRDANQVVQLIVPEAKTSDARLIYKPSEEAELPGGLANEVNLREAFAKVLLKRAQAGEMLEKWSMAAADWTLLETYEKREGSGKSGPLNLRSAAEGKKRCQSMLGKARNAASATPSGPRAVAPPPRKAVPGLSSAALAQVQAATKARIATEAAAVAAEDAQKLSLKDSVDARVLAWKAGKENNVRALIASVENVVWSGLAWKKVGMHELVTDAQVKKAYTRAIGRLHPDKLTPRNTSVEERMIATAVFSVLNGAWANSQKK